MSLAISESQRDSVQQPRVGEPASLPWVTRRKHLQPQRGCIAVSSNRQNPFRVETFSDSRSQGSRVAPTLGWMAQPRWGRQAEQKGIVARVEAQLHDSPRLMAHTRLRKPFAT